MPVTVYPSQNQGTLLRTHGSVRPENANDVLKLVYPDRGSYSYLEERYATQDEETRAAWQPLVERSRTLNSLGILQSSLDQDFPPELMPNGKGLFAAAKKAYSSHHHLILRPDDIWAAIVVQLSFYINAHAEELRSSFVAHEGKKGLKIVYDPANRYSFNYERLAEDMSVLIQKNVVDPDLREWVLPAFSTTTTQDKILGCIFLMATMQEYFDYTVEFDCGLPSVTLLGTKADWELINQRIEKLCSWGEEATCFRNLLKPVTKRLVSTFDRPEADETKDFWQRIFKHERGGSGPTWYSGWITAFICWNEKGERLYSAISEQLSGSPHGISSVEGLTDNLFGGEGLSLCMDGVIYHKLTGRQIPAGLCTMPVKIIDNGEELSTEMVAGFLGYSCTSSGNHTENGEIGLDTIQPYTGWFIYEKADTMSL